MSHTRGLKRKNAFLQSEGKTTPAVARIMQEIEAERQKKERLEWYLNEVMKEKELLSRFDDASAATPAAVDAFLAQSSCSTSASTSTSTTSSSSSSSSPLTSSVGHTTYVATDYNRWVSDATTVAAAAAAAAKVPAEPVAASVSSVASNVEPVESCARCGCQYVDSQQTCRCRNFESVKKRQRCLSRFVRTGHLLEEETATAGNNAITANDVLLSFDLQAFPFVMIDPSTTTTTATTAVGEDILANISDDDFLRMILDDSETCTTISNSSSLKAVAEPASAFLGEKSQRRRRASFVGAKDGWDAMLGTGEDNYFATGAAASTAVFGY